MKLKINFFTIVRNGMPFIRHHWDILYQLKCDWHWHVVEGTAALKHDTAWSLRTGGRLPEEVKKDTLSTDGTTEYIDELVKNHPGRITVYRKPQGELWNGKLEMVQAPLVNIHEDCLLWQIDVDEFWTTVQIEAVTKAFNKEPSKTSAWYWCNFYVGPETVVSTRNCYSQNPKQEWLRTWHFKPCDRWGAHEPPTLLRKSEDGSDLDVGKISPMLHAETEKLGAVFDHFAYVSEQQLRFKEQYYGYVGALAGWKNLQKSTQSRAPELLSKYFSWVSDSTYVQCIGSNGVLASAVSLPMVLIDGIAFQDPWNPGICRVWTAVIECLVSRGWGKYVSVLDRGNTFPQIPGINKIAFPRWEKGNAAADSLKIDNACRDTQSEVFISTLHTISSKTPSVTLIHDFIPEKLGVSPENPGVVDKRLAVLHASRLLCVSESTRNDLLEYFPDLDPVKVRVAHLGVSTSLYPRSIDVIMGFREKYQITKPYFLFVGERVGLLGEAPPARGYKNAKLVFDALCLWGRSSDYNLLIVGGSPELERELHDAAPSIQPIMIRASEEELAAAYSGAVALIYPSNYEGFGLPVAEAMKCGCPVITSKVSSLPEVGGKSPIYIDPNNVHSLIGAMEEVIKPSIRDAMVTAGLGESQRFQWDGLACALQEALKEAASIGVEQPELWSRLSEARAQQEAAMHKFKNQEAECSSIKGSLSWKCTAPLRGMDAFVMKYLKKKRSDY